MSDRIFFSLAALLAILMIALASVAPQGQGVRSPGPFGHAPSAAPPTPAPLARAAAALAKLRPRQ